MATFTKKKLSGSTDGRPIAIAATSTPGTTLHTSVSGTTVGKFDEIWLYVVNIGSAFELLTLEFGGTSTSDDLTVRIAPSTGLVLVIPGLILQNGAIMKAFASTTNLLNAVGYVNAIDP